MADGRPVTRKRQDFHQVLVEILPIFALVNRIQATPAQGRSRRMSELRRRAVLLDLVGRTALRYQVHSTRRLRIAVRALVVKGPDHDPVRIDALLVDEVVTHVLGTLESDARALTRIGVAVDDELDVGSDCIRQRRRRAPPCRRCRRVPSCAGSCRARSAGSAQYHHRLVDVDRHPLGADAVRVAVAGRDRNRDPPPRPVVSIDTWFGAIWRSEPADDVHS